MLVTSRWLYDNLNDVKVIEVNYTPEINYFESHIPSALLLEWKDLLHDKIRDFAPPDKISKVLGRLGISKDDTIVLYSDEGNRYAFYAYWVLKAYGHENVNVLDGGIYKWTKDQYPLTSEVPDPQRLDYVISKVDWSSRIFIFELLSKLNQIELIDARSREEYEGIITAPPERKCEQTQVSGHIPGARNIPWNTLFNEDITLKSKDELQKIFHNVDGSKEVVTYCRTGARSSVVWFALKEVLGYKNVKLYDGSWVEYGNLVGVPVESSNK